MVAGSADEAGRTGADRPTVQRVGVTHRALVTGVTDACVLQVTQQTCGFNSWVRTKSVGRWVKERVSERKEERQYRSCPQDTRSKTRPRGRDRWLH